jgi:hypothetical protein
MLSDDLDHEHAWVLVVAVVSLVAAFGFLLYGGRCDLYSLMLDVTVIANIDGVPFSVLFSQSSFAPS